MKNKLKDSFIDKYILVFVTIFLSFPLTLIIAFSKKMQ